MNKNYEVKRMKGNGEFMITPLDMESARRMVKHASRIAIWVDGWCATLPGTKDGVLRELLGNRFDDTYRLPIKLYICGDNKPVLHVSGHI